jgi:hypothetical protein
MKHLIKQRVTAAAGIVTLSAFALLPLLTHTTYAAAPSAQVLLQRASRIATAENKNILVHFGSSW